MAVARRNLIALITVAAASLFLGSISEAMLPSRPAAVLGHVLGWALTSNQLQWTVLGFAIYGLISWSQFIRIRDRVAHELVVSTPAFVVLSVSSGMVAITTYSVLAFFFIYATRYFAFRPQDALTLGIVSAVASTAGMVSGGVCGDHFRRWFIPGRLYFIMVSMIMFLVTGFITFTTANLTMFVCFYALMSYFYPLGSACIYATGQDLVLPRLRGLSFSVITVTTSVMGLGLGPYLVGLASDTTGDLRFAILSSFTALPIAVLGFWFVATRLSTTESKVVQRADGQNDFNFALVQSNLDSVLPDDKK